MHFCIAIESLRMNEHKTSLISYQYICDNQSRKGSARGSSAEDNFTFNDCINDISLITNKKLIFRMEYRLNTRAFKVV